MLSSHCVCFLLLLCQKLCASALNVPMFPPEPLTIDPKPWCSLKHNTFSFNIVFPNNNFFPWASIWVFDRCGSICWWDLVVHKGFVGGWLQGLMITFSPLWLTSRPAWWCFLAPPVNLPAGPSAAIQGHLVGGPLRGRFKSTPRWFVFSQGGGGGDLIGQIFQILPNYLHQQEA